MIPDERPFEGGAPEIPEGLSSITVDCADQIRAVEETVARLDDAELVAFRVSQDGMRLIGALTDVHVPGPETQCPVGHQPLAVQGIEVNPDELGSHTGQRSCQETVVATESHVSSTRLR